MFILVDNCSYHRYTKLWTRMYVSDVLIYIQEHTRMFLNIYRTLDVKST